MKNIFIYIIILSSLFTSCDDYLDLKPKNVVTVQDASDVKKLVGSYMRKLAAADFKGNYDIFYIKGHEEYSGGTNLKFEKFEDNLDFSGMDPYQFSEYEKGPFRWQNPIFEQDIWKNLFSKIGEFNLFLHEIERVGGSSEEMKSIKAEILMQRALNYFRLVQYFCPYRVGKDVADPERYGLPFVTSFDNLSDNYFPQRLTQKETYEFILKDLNHLEQLNAAAIDYNIIYNKRAAYGLMAEFYMWRAESPAKEPTDWENARKYAQKSKEGGNPVNSLATLENMFNTLATSGSPALSYELNGQYHTALSEFYRSPFNLIVAHDDLYNLYDASDIRRDFYINGSTKIIQKFDLFDAAGKIRKIMWRVAEMQLIIAESYIREGDNINALKYLDEFKQSRIPGFTSYANTDILDEIIRERRKEFLCERNYRWLDMKRNGVVVNRISSDGTTETLEAGDFRYTFLIPGLGELDVNPNNFQNPGWNSLSDED